MRSDECNCCALGFKRKTGAMAVPLHRAIFETLRNDIREGRYLKSFPSESQLVRRFDASRQTVIRAMGELVKEGLVERRRGSGTVVSRRVRQTLGHIGLILPLLSSSPFTAAFAEVCKEEGYTLMFRNLVGKDCLSFETLAKEAFAIAREFAAAKVLGVLMQPVQNIAGFERFNREMLATFSKRRIPVVLVDHDAFFPPARSGCDVVCMDNFHAGYAIGRHLVERGARKVAFLMHGDWAPSVMERLHGVSSAVIEAGLGWKPAKNVIACRADDGKSIARALRTFRADAIDCGNDIEAALLLKTLKGLGISVPDEIRVTGVDDAQHAALLSPSLTTVRQDFAQIARIAANRLAWRIHNPDEPPVTIQIRGELIVREST